MTALIKYELLKQKKSKILLGAFLGIFEIVYLLGLLIHNDVLIPVSILGLTVTSFTGFLVVALEAINTYYKDLTEKSGYMVFMTPNSEYTILGSKILSAILTIVIWTVFIGVLAFADISLLVAVYGNVEEMLEMLRLLALSILGVNVSWGTAVYTLIYIVLAWINLMSTAFLAITLAVTAFRGKKYNGLVSFVVFIGLNYICTKVLELVGNLLGISVADGFMVSMEATTESIDTTVSGMSSTGVGFVFTLIFTVIFFIMSGTLLKKKLAL